MSAPSTLGLILAGGRSRRFHGTDKAFIKLAGIPLWQRVLARLAPQVDAVAISSNAAPQLFAVGTEDRAPIAVLPDLIAGFQGPLAGIHAGLSTWPERYIVTVAVDLPFMPMDLVAQLAAGLHQGSCAYATAVTQHVLALLWAPGTAGDIAAFLDHGGRSVHDWLVQRGDPVLFTAPGDADLFFNINTPEDLAVAERRLCDPARA